MTDPSPRTLKALALVVIATCLGMQTYAIVRPSEARFWPFIDYPMYSRSFRPGATFRTRQLRAGGCAPDTTSRAVASTELGYLSFHLRERLSAIAAGAPAASAFRESLSRAASTMLTPRPCTLEVWERSVTMTERGVDPAELRAPRWRLRASWRTEPSPGASDPRGR